MPEKKQEVERRLAAEWMAEHYKDREYYLNYPLGPLPAGMPDMRRAIPWLRKVDGLAINNGTVDLVEFKVYRPWDGLDKLPAYKMAIPHTPWLGIAKDYPVRMILVTAMAHPTIEATAPLLGVEVIKVAGGWIDEVIARRLWLWTKEGREAMAEKHRLRKWLGLD